VSDCGKGAAPLATVVVTFYRGRELLAEALRSLDRQTWKGFDAVLVDDGSAEDVSGGEFARPWLRYLRQENAGAPAAKNRGVAAGKGRYVSFLDYDDVMHPERLARLLAASERTPAAAVVVGGIKNFRTTSVQTDIEPVVAGVCGGGVLVRRDVFGKDGAGPFDEGLRLNYFMDWWMRLDRARFPVVECRDAVCYRRLHDANSSLIGAETLKKGATRVIFDALKRRRQGG
jgi:glycosyltransferase involved in cell wall biosynthesis